MNLKTIFTHLLKKDTPDEEERLDVPEKSQPAPSQDSPNTKDKKKAGVDAGATVQSGGATNEVVQDPEHDDDQEYDDTLPNDDFEVQTDASPRGLPRVFLRISSFISPSPSNEEEIQAHMHHYRILPIISGIVIPFSILLDIPGLTADWYIRTDNSTIVASRPNPPLLDVGVALSLLCAVLANGCLVARFLERRVKTMTILCTVFLSIHDIINIIALAAFGATRGDYTFSQAFWMTLCSTIVSMLTNVTLIIDLILTRDFKRSGSGLTRRQRSLVIIIIGLFCYIALGALANSLLLHLSFIDGLYFTVVTIETIGFGDIVPNSKSSRLFICFYAILGVINLAFVVGYVRETVLEGLDFGYRRRLLAIQERRRVARRRKRAENRWRHAVVWRLRELQAPVWIPKNTNNRKFLWSMLVSFLRRAEWGIRSTVRRSTHKTRRRRGMQLNLWTLPPCQLEAAALEAGLPLDSLLPPDFYDTYDQDACEHVTGAKHHASPSWFAVHPVYGRDENALTHRRLGAMAAILTKLGFAIYESGGSPLPNGYGVQDDSAEDATEEAQDSVGSLQTGSSDGDYREDVADTEKKAYYTRTGLSWGWFLIFWMGGAAIFKATEGWSYGTAIYFCFISFTTIGYGDYTPTTAAGRSVFVVWALIGVATITIFISVVSEAYTTRYKGILGRNSFKHVIRQYRQRNTVELRGKVQSTSVSNEVVLRSAVGQEGIEVVEGESSPVNLATNNGIINTAIASTSKSDQHIRHVQRSLEKLPKQILTETRSIQQYMRLIGDLDGHSAEAEKSMWNLLDDVMGEKKLADHTKRDILKDGESRQTLMLLGIERSLKELVNTSEEAIAAIQERDQIIATLERERDQDEEEIGQERE